MRNIHRVPMALSLCALLWAVPAMAKEDAYYRDYPLRTLDSRVAEHLVWEICRDHIGNTDHCQVQGVQSHQLNVLAPRGAHVAIVAMLLERDVELPASLGFQIVLVRAASEENGMDGFPAHIRKALDAVRELLSYSSFEIVDQVLLRTGTSGRTLMQGPGKESLEVVLTFRSAVTRMDSTELTVDLELSKAEERPRVRLLSSVLTLAVGETVVAGTSRLSSGQQTLLVLATSLPFDSDG